MVAVEEYNPFAPEVKEDPYPYYAWLRAERPVYQNETLGFWAISRYADVVAAARDTEAFSSAQGIGPEKVRLPMMITQDPPAHRRLRSLAGKAFTPRMVAGQEGRIREIVNELLDRVIEGGSFDLTRDLAYPLPVIVIAEMLGVEPERRDDFKRWSDAVIGTFNGPLQGDRLGEYLQTWNEFKAYFTETIEQRRREPRDDLITNLIRADEGGTSLTESEMLNFCLLLLVAGNETTTNLITNGALALFTHPKQAALLRERPQLIESMVEESLRYDSPIQGTFRTTTRDVEVAGETIPADSKVILLWSSANRDAGQFAEPDRYDITRADNDHVAFGIGIHFCLGAPLARLEARVATQEVLRRMRNIRPDPDAMRERVDNPFFRGLKHYRLLFEPAT
jgi:cytochrome P450